MVKWLLELCSGNCIFEGEWGLGEDIGSRLIIMSKSFGDPLKLLSRLLSLLIECCDCQCAESRFWALNAESELISVTGFSWKSPLNDDDKLEKLTGLVIECGDSVSVMDGLGWLGTFVCGIVIWIFCCEEFCGGEDSFNVLWHSAGLLEFDNACGEGEELWKLLERSVIAGVECGLGLSEELERWGLAWIIIGEGKLFDECWGDSWDACCW